MSKSDAAVDGGSEDECPLCLEPLPPFWVLTGRKVFICCGRATCKNCADAQNAYLDNAENSGTWGREEEQLGTTCPLCRAQNPTGDGAARILLDRFEKGQLPLNMYYTLGGIFLKEEAGVERNVERGTEILMLGANKGSPKCQYELGCIYGKGDDGLPQSTTEAKRWYLAAAEQGHAMAEYNLALMSRDEGNDAEYLRYLRSSALKGFNEASFSLGVIYSQGIHGEQQSIEEAIRVLTPAAEGGHAKSMGLLGDIMCAGAWLPPKNANLTKGMHWLRQAAAKGEQLAISQLKKVEEWASNKCFMCNKEAPPENAFLRCSRCRAAWYCSKDCQVQHWKAAEAGHKQFCIKWKEGDTAETN